MALPVLSWLPWAGGGGCCTLACTRRRWEPRNHEEQPVGSDRVSVPMCVDPPDRTWEPNHHTRPSPKKTVIPTKTSPFPAEAPPSHVQHRRQPHPPGTPTTPHTEIGPVPARDRSDSTRANRRRDAHDELEGESHMPHLRTSGEQQPRGSTTDLEPEYDRSRREFRPISTRKRTDLGAELDRSRRLLL